jgi:hypothetical protein
LKAIANYKLVLTKYLGDPMTQPDFTLPDPQRDEFEQQYKGMKRPHFGGGNVTMCRPMTEIELEQYRLYCELQGRSLGENENEYQMPF